MIRTFFRWAALGLVVVEGIAWGTPTYSCPQTVDVCHGNNYAVWMVSQSGNTYQVEVDVQVTSNYLLAPVSGSITDLISSIQIKDFTNGTVTDPTLISAPGGTAGWILASSELNANGCTGGSGSDTFCVGSTGAGAALFSGSTPLLLSWVFQFNLTGTLDTTVGDLKYLYTDSNGNKLGSLGSYGVDLQCSVDGCGPPGIGPSGVIPEPVTYVLAGTGLIAMYFARRRGLYRA